MKRSWFRKILKGLSLTSAMFVFQACYGTEEGFFYDMLVEGQVTSSTTGLPIKQIKVSLAENRQYDYTDDSGKFSFYTEKLEGLTLQFEDIDSTENGSFIARDTVLTDLSDSIYVTIALEEK